MHMDTAAGYGSSKHILIKAVSTNKQPLLSRNAAKPSSFRQSNQLNQK